MGSKKQKRRWLCGVLAAVLVGTTVGAVPVRADTGQNATDRTMAVWVQNSADRAFASAQMPAVAEQTIALYAARNEYEAAQILVRSEGGLHGLSLAASALSGPDGAEIAADNIAIFREYSAEAKVPGDAEPTPDGSSLYTDALLPNTALDVAASVTQPYWVRVYVPKDQTPGEYTGAVTVTAQEGTFTVPVSVRVYDVTIPDTDEASFKMINWFSTAGVDYGVLESSVPNQYGVELLDENWWKVMESFARDLSQHRNNVIFMDAVALLLPESTLLPEDNARAEFVTGEDGKMAAGRYLLDWNNFDRMVDLFRETGALQYIYLAGNSMVVRGSDSSAMMLYMMDEENGGMTRVKAPIYADQEAGTVNPEAAAYVKTIYKALRSHMEERYPALVDKLYVSALDEPSTTAENQASNWFYSTVREVYPEALSNEAHSRFITGMTASTTLCPVLDIYENNQTYYQTQKAEGKELWFYTCIGPQGDYLNRFIPYHLIKTRLIPWYAYQIGASGYLHWGYSYWGMQDPFDSVQTGDEWLVRPDVAHYDVFTSVRNEAQLDGLEDYELLTQLAAKDKAAADRVADTLIETATRYTRDGAAATAAHKTLLDLLTGQETEPIATTVFADAFDTGYDYAWTRDGKAGTGWSVQDGAYLYHGAGSNQTGMTTLRSQTVKNGKIDVTLQVGDVYGNDSTMWGGVTFRKARATDDAFTSGYTLYLKKNGTLELFRAQPFAVLCSKQAVLDAEGKVRLTISLEGSTISVYQDNQLLTTVEDSTALEGCISLTGTGADVAFSEFRLYSYDGVEESRVSTAVVRDQSYKDAFTGGMENWRVEGEASAETGALRFPDGGSAGLEGRVFSACEVSFTCNLDGEQTTSEAKDHWAGLTLGKETVYGDIWGHGGYLLLLRKTGVVELLSRTGTVASTETGQPLAGDTAVRVVRTASELKVYLNGGTDPVLTAEAPDYPEGFLALSSYGGAVCFDDLTVTGVRSNADSVLLEDFSGDLSRWHIVQEPEHVRIADGALETTGVVRKQDSDQGIQGTGVSPELVYQDRTFQNVRIGFDVKLNDVALAENWAGAYFHSGGTDGFWKSGGYLVYVTNTRRLVVYRGGDLAAAELPCDPMEQSVHLEVELRDGKIRVYVDYAATPLVEVEDYAYTQGFFGLMSDFSDATFDNLYYQDLGAAEEPEEPDWNQSFSDSFAEDIGSWKLVSAAAGRMEIGGALQLTGTSGADPAMAALYGRAYTDLELSVELTLPKASAGWSGVAFGRARWNDTIWSNGYFLYGGKLDDETAELKLFKANVGDVAKVETVCGPDGTCKLRLRITGQTMEVFAGNGNEPVLTYSDAAYQGGFLALLSYMSRNSFRQFRVDPGQIRHGVMLPEIFAGADSVADGEDYTFAETDSEHYVYGEVSATMRDADGAEHPAEVLSHGDGTYTVGQVRGPLTISGSRTPQCCAVTFDSCGGSSVPSQTVCVGAQAVEPPAPHKPGYRFEGWYTEAGRPYDFTQPVTGALTLLARWSRIAEPEPPVPHTPAAPTDDTAAGQTFADVPKGHWAWETVAFVTGNGLFQGVNETQFAPDAAMTRAMLVTVLWRLEGRPAAAAAGFADVTAGAWYEAAVNWAAQAGIVNGVEANNFAPTQPVTREQIAAILWRLSGRADAAQTLQTYPDGGQVSAYAAAAMAWAVQEGLFRGDGQGCLRPRDTATRAEVAALIQRYAGLQN